MMSLTFAEPFPVNHPSECVWYQTFDWPDGTVVKGRWDYRPNVEDYLGHIEYSGRTVIELGPASGYLTYAMGERGAAVTCIDLDPKLGWEVVPRQDRNTEAYLTNRIRGLRRLRNSWWLSQKVFHGTARMSECGAAHLFELRTALKFDIGFIGSVLQHFESPYRVLSALAAMCETIVVTEQLHKRLQLENRHLAEFLPAHNNNHLGTWWLLSPSTVDRMMGTLNFEKAASYRNVFRRYDFKKPTIEEDSFIDYPFYTHVYRKKAVDASCYDQISEA